MSELSDLAFMIAVIVIGITLFIGLHLIITSGATDDGGVNWQEQDYEWFDNETGDKTE